MRESSSSSSTCPKPGRHLALAPEYIILHVLPLAPNHQGRIAAWLMPRRCSGHLTVVTVIWTATRHQLGPGNVGLSFTQLQWSCMYLHPAHGQGRVIINTVLVPEGRVSEIGALGSHGSQGATCNNCTMSCTGLI